MGATTRDMAGVRAMGTGSAKRSAVGGSHRPFSFRRFLPLLTRVILVPAAVAVTVLAAPLVLHDEQSPALTVSGQSDRDLGSGQQNGGTPPRPLDGAGKASAVTSPLPTVRWAATDALLLALAGMLFLSTTMRPLVSPRHTRPATNVRRVRQPQP